MFRRMAKTRSPAWPLLGEAEELVFALALPGLLLALACAAIFAPLCVVPAAHLILANQADVVRPAEEVAIFAVARALLVAVVAGHSVPITGWVRVRRRVATTVGHVVAGAEGRPAFSVVVLRGARD